MTTERAGSFAMSEAPGIDLGTDPRDDLVEHLVEGRRGFEAEDVSCLRHVRHAHLDVVLERRIGDVAERPVWTVDLPPDQLGELEGPRSALRREGEVLNERPLR